MPSIELLPIWGATWYSVSSWGHYGDQLDTWYRVEPFRAPTRYQVSSCSLILGSELGVVLRKKLCIVRTIRIRLTWTRTSRVSLTSLLVLWCCDAALLLLYCVALCCCWALLLLFCVATVVHCCARALTLCPSLTLWQQLLDTHIV